MIDKESIIKYDLWLCFLTKLLALTYDEAFDNINSLLNIQIKEIKFLLKIC